MAYFFFRFYFVCSLIEKCLALYQLSGNPSTIVVGDNVTMVMTCTVDDDFKYVIWRQTNTDGEYKEMATIRYDNCTVKPEADFGGNNGYNFHCDLTRKEYFLEIAVIYLQEEISNYRWICVPPVGSGSNYWSPTSFVPITTVYITPLIGNTKNVSIIEGKIQQFTCTTDAGRPAAWIQWYIGGQNITNQATLVKSSNGTKFVSHSTLNHTGIDADHNKEVYCEAINIEGRQNITSEKIALYIQLPVTDVNITPFVGNSNNVSIVLGETQQFTCTTDAGRPAAWIQWYIKGQNETNRATLQTSSDGTKFVSKSSLNHTATDADHNQKVYCEAFNIEGGLKVKSTKLTLSIKVPVSNVTIQPIGVNDIVFIETNNAQTFSCETDFSRPAASIQWIIGTKSVTNNVTTTIISNGTKSVSYSTLNYTGNDSDHNKTIHCRAVNTEQRMVNSTKKTIYIQLSVQKAEIMPVGHDDVISVVFGKTKTFTCTTDSSRPAARIQWYIGEKNLTTDASTETYSDDTKFISKSSLNYTGKDADHNYVIYCEALNIEGKKVTSVNKTFYVIVPITTVFISPTFLNKSVIVISKTDFNFSCKTSASRPGARIHWYIGEENVTNGTMSVITSFGTKFISSSNFNYTGKIADHNQTIHCEAVNSYNRIKSQEESLYVLRSTTNDETYDLHREIFIGTREGLDLIVFLIANPMPKITWTFVSDQKPSENVIITEFNITSEDTFHHVTSYSKERAEPLDFGNYTIEADNGIGPEFLHVFAVKPAQAPSPPFNLDAVCDQKIPLINISWISNFNGGTQQTFYVVVRNMKTNIGVKSSPETDNGQTIIHSYNKLFDYDSVYEIHVEARNKHGVTNSSNSVNCTTLKETPQSSGSSSTLIGGVAGSIFALVVVAVIGVVVFILRQKKNKGDERLHLHCLKGRTEDVDENEEEGLRDNPLYGTSGVSVEYDHVPKLTKAKNPSTAETRYKNPNKKKACVYKYSDDPLRDEANNLYGNVNEDGSSTAILESNDRKTKKNKDGLIYADLELASPENGKPFVIRGLENKTNYAMIDLSKKAEPLPPDSDEDAITGYS